MDIFETKNDVFLKLRDRIKILKTKDSTTFFTVDDMSLLKMVVGNVYTVIFSKNRKIQIKHDTPRDLEDIVQKILSLSKDEDVLKMKGSQIVEDFLSEKFEKESLEFQQISRKGETFFKCLNPQNIGLEVLIFGEDFSIDRLKYGEDVSSLSDVSLEEIPLMGNLWKNKVDDLTNRMGNSLRTIQKALEDEI